MKTLHYKTIGRRLKNIMLHQNFDEITINASGVNCYYVSFPTGEELVIWSSGPDLYYSYPVAIEYYSAEREEKGRLTVKHKIAGQFIFALHRFLDSEREINMFEKTFIDELRVWSRHWNRQYAKYFHSNEDILSV